MRFVAVLIAIFAIWVQASGVALSIILVGARFCAVWLCTQKTPIKKDRSIMTLVLTRGLAAAVLATLPAQYNLPYADLFVSVAVVIIVTTAIIATAGSLAIARVPCRKNSGNKPSTNNHTIVA